MTIFVVCALAAFAQGLVASALLTRVGRALGPRLGMVDVPNESRKVHTQPTPRSGGIGVFTAFWGCLALDLALAALVAPRMEWLPQLPQSVRDLAANTGSRMLQLGGIAGGSLVIFLVGAVDDARGLSPKLRLAFQIAAAGVLVATGTRVHVFLPMWAGAAITICWVVALTNSFNFLDNMNGLTSGVAVIVCGVLALQSALAHEYYMMFVFGLLGGAAMGFWFYNFPKASVFLGDNGSTHLGFLIAALTIECTFYTPGVPTQLPVLMPVAVLGVPIFDTASVMWIRWRSGKPLMQGDANHFSHRLVALGMSKVEAVIFIYGVTLCVGLAAVVLRAVDWRYGLVQVAVLGMMFAGIYWMERVAKKRLKAEG